MTAAILNLNNGTLITAELVKVSANQFSQAVLLTLQGHVHGDTQNCCLIPLGKIQEVHHLLDLVAGAAKP